MDRSNALELTFVMPGDEFATRAGFLATIEEVDGFRVLGTIETDYCIHDAIWRQDGTAEMACDDLVEKIPPPQVPERKTLWQRITGYR